MARRNAHKPKITLGRILIGSCIAYTLAHAIPAYGHDLPHMSHGEHKTISRLGKKQYQRFNPGPSCAYIGAWEDGSVVAYCVEGSTLGTGYVTHGPDGTDAWATYHGPVPQAWEDRVDRLDGQVG